MFLIVNKTLERLIRESKTLNAKLSPKQLERFLEEAYALPEEGQEELMAKLQEERADWERKEQKRLLELFHKVKLWEKKVKAETADILVLLRKDAEQVQVQTDTETEDSLIQKLQDA